MIPIYIGVKGEEKQGMCSGGAELLVCLADDAPRRQRLTLSIGV